MQTALHTSIARVCGSSRVSLRAKSQRVAAAPLRRASIAVRAAAEPKSAAERAEETQAAATTALLVTAGLLAPLLLDADAAQAVPELLKGRTFSLIHPAMMFFLFGSSIYAGYLGFQWRHARELVGIIKEKKAQRPAADAEGNRPSSPLDAEISALEAERKNLIGQKLNEKHNNWGSMLLGLGVLMSVAGPLNTFFRTGKLFPGPHLYAGAAITVLWALAASLVPAMQKGNNTARSAHIALNSINVLLFAWQIPTGWEIVEKNWQPERVDRRLWRRKMDGGGLGSPGATVGGYTQAALMAKGKEKEKELLDHLKAYFIEKGHPLEEGWRVEVKIRTTGTSLGTTDAYYFSPSDKRFRSRIEIARFLGLVEGKEPKAGGKGGGSGGKGRGRKSDGTAAVPPPLTRVDAVTEARRRSQEFRLPATLACGVTVTSLGHLHPGNPAFCNAQRLWPAGYVSEWVDEKGVRFINSITETPSGPIFRIKAQRLGGEGRPATEVVELGAGPSPDDAYKDAEERQSEALEIALLNRRIKHRGGGQPQGDDGDGSPGRALDSAERLLVKCRPLNHQWGLERFGLADPLVLQAIEGLPGADQCPRYVFVDERPGAWVAECRKLNVELATHGKQQVPVEARRANGGGGAAAGEGSAQRKRPPRPSRKEAEEIAVRRVLEGVVTSIEVEEMSHYTEEQQQQMKLINQAQRDRKKADRDKMSTAMHKMREQQRLQQKAAAIEAQRRQAELNATVEDTELPQAGEEPPLPGPVATGRLPPHQQAVLLEAWQFVSRFGAPLLKLAEGERLPSLQQLEAALLGEEQPAPAPPAEPLSPTAAGRAAAAEGQGGETVAPAPDSAVRLMMVLVDFLVGGLFSDTAKAILDASGDISMADLRGPGKAVQHPLPIKPDTWQEAARRHLTILATSSMTQAKDGGTAGVSSPLAVMDPWVVLQYLTAGPPSSLTQGAAALPRGASNTAGHSVIARADAAALAAAEQAFAAASGASLGVEEARLTQQLLRCVLRDVIHASKLKKGDGRVLSYGGQAAAAAAKFGRPLDLKCIAARIDAGVYCALPQPLAAFASDLKYACSLVQAGCNKSSTHYAHEYNDKAAPELAALAVSKLEQAVAEIEGSSAAEYIAQHAPLPRVPRRTPEGTPLPAAGGAGASGEEGTPAAAAAPPREASAEPGSATPAAAGAEDEQRSQQGVRQVTDAVRDLDRPFAPFKEQGSWRGCVACWTDDDPLRLLPCDTCDCQLHTYCLQPPLEEAPLQTEPFLCPRCTKLHGPHAANGGTPLAVDEWSVEQRCALLRLLSTLCAESAQVHDSLHGEEDEAKEKRREIAQLKQDVKRLQADMQQQQQQQQPGAEGGQGEGHQAQAQRATRRGGRDPAADIESKVEEISKLEHDISQVGPVRLEPLGLDRHYNRYWMLPAPAAAPHADFVLPDAPPVLVVERHSLDSLRPVGVEAAAAALGQQGQGASGGGVGVWHVGLYSSILHLQQLAQWLNPKGTRERPLAGEVTRLLDQHQQFAMQHPQLPRPPAAEERPPLDAGAQRAAAVARLQQALLSFEEGNQGGTYDDLAGSEQRRQTWRAMVAAASTPQALAAALLVLEGMVRPEYLKPHWRPFSMPAPHPSDTGTLSAVWLRLEALKTSVKLKLTLNMRALKDVMGGALIPSGGTRYSLREHKPALKRAYCEDPDAASQSDEDETHETRAERAAKRAKQRESPGMQQQLPDDEVVARQLDAQLNPGSQRTRARTAPGHRQPGAAGDEEEWEDDDEEDGQEGDSDDQEDAEMDEVLSDDE
ncbi:Methyl-CpG-binding domain protein 2 [Chlorella vulgaris]